MKSRNKGSSEQENTTPADTFLALITHELRTPITLIRSQIQMNLSGYYGKITKEQKKSFEMIHKNADRLNHLVGDILDITNLKSGQMKFILEKTSLAIILRSIKEQYKPICKEKNIKIQFKKSPKVTFICDKLRIFQVLSNLINNSLKFTSAKGKITIWAEEKKHKIQFFVQDNGLGIQKSDHTSVFSPFKQYSDFSTNKKGYGLGLSICRGIVEAHKGKIWSKEIPQGCLITFTLSNNLKEQQKEKSILDTRDDKLNTRFVNAWE